MAEPQMVQRYQYGNHLGSAALELTEDREVISYEEYHPYGTSSYRAANSGVDVSERRYRYTGKERDEETGLGHQGARYYACWLGRWTASDPIGLGDGVNRYAYVSGNPVSSSDPSGTEGVDLKRGEIISKEQFQSAADGELSISAQDIALRLPGDRGEHLIVPKNAVRYDRSIEGDQDHIGVALESSRWEKRYAIATLELQHRRQTEIGALHILGSKKVIQATAIIGVSGGVSFGLASAGAVVGAGGLALDVVLASAEGAALAEVDGTAAGEGALSSGLSGLGAAGLGKLFGKALGPLVEAAANKADDVLRGVSRSAKDGVEEGLGGVQSIVDDLAPTSQRAASAAGGEIPQGFSEAQFGQFSKTARSGAGHLGDDIAVHGSRASGTAKATSDIDIAIRVSPENFDELISARFGTPNLGSAKERTMQHAISTGKIQAGEAGLRGLRKQLANEAGMPVDISVIRVGGQFDKGPYIPLRR